MTAVELLESLIDDLEDTIQDYKDTISRTHSRLLPHNLQIRIDELKQWQRSLIELLEEQKEESE